MLEGAVSVIFSLVQKAESAGQLISGGFNTWLILILSVETQELESVTFNQ
ncbi:hypothetical protein QWZ08_06970 [Ferruginibacter paludis]|nr:hypothetical protein [Ferruginibacter paludis]MDN3655358.1 hypothetical protein [Ferruginibacter paludis]